MDRLFFANADGSTDSIIAVRLEAALKRDLEFLDERLPTSVFEVSMMVPVELYEPVSEDNGAVVTADLVIETTQWPMCKIKLKNFESISFPMAYLYKFDQLPVELVCENLDQFRAINELKSFVEKPLIDLVEKWLPESDEDHSEEDFVRRIINKVFAFQSTYARYLGNNPEKRSEFEGFSIIEDTKTALMLFSNDLKVALGLL